MSNQLQCNKVPETPLVAVKQYKRSELQDDNGWCLTECEYARVDDVGAEEQDGAPDGLLVAEVGVDDGEAAHQADGPVDHHAQAPEEHRSEPVPVAA